MLLLFLNIFTGTFVVVRIGVQCAVVRCCKDRMILRHAVNLSTC